MMVRILLTASLVLGAVTSMTGSASAAANARAVCLAEHISGSLAGPGFGQFVSGFAQTGELGGAVSQEASTDTCE